MTSGSDHAVVQIGYLRTGCGPASVTYRSELSEGYRKRIADSERVVSRLIGRGEWLRSTSSGRLQRRHALTALRGAELRRGLVWGAPSSSSSRRRNRTTRARGEERKRPRARALHTALDGLAFHVVGSRSPAGSRWYTGNPAGTSGAAANTAGRPAPGGSHCRSSDHRHLHSGRRQDHGGLGRLRRPGSPRTAQRPPPCPAGWLETAAARVAARARPGRERSPPHGGQITIHHAANSVRTADREVIVGCAGRLGARRPGARSICWLTIRVAGRCGCRGAGGRPAWCRRSAGGGGGGDASTRRADSTGGLCQRSRRRGRIRGGSRDRGAVEVLPARPR